MSVTQSNTTKFLRWARTHPDRPALSDCTVSLTYAELRQRVLGLAAQLRAAGLQPGDFAAVACSRSVDGVVGILAVVVAGGAYVPLDLAYPAARLKLMLDDVRPRLLVATPPQRAGLPAGDLITVSPAPAARVTPLSHPLAVAAAAPAVVLFSSGSTGRPKGSVLPRRALERLVGWHVEHPRLGRSARVLQFVKFGFDVASCDIFGTLATGGTLVLAPQADRVDPFRLLDLLCEQAIERVYLPGAALHSLAQAHAVSRRSPAALREVLTAGEPLLVTSALRGLFAALPGSSLLNLYGPSECVYVTSQLLDGDPARWPSAPDIGAALPYVRLHVVDAELRPVASGESGELLIGSGCMADGYLGRPELTAERFIACSDAEGRRQRVYRSGDQVRQNADGTLHFIGRQDDQVKIAGNRLELGEVEAALLAYPQLRQAAAIALSGPSGPQLLACVVAADGVAANAALEQALRAHMALGLPDYACPVRYLWRESLPMSVNDKVDRQRLAGELQATRNVVAVAATGSLQDRVLGVWRDVLASPATGPDDNVFEHGADSLRVMSFITRLRELEIGSLAASRVYELTSARQQAAALSGGQTAAPTTPATAAKRPASVPGLAALRARQRGVQP